MATVRSAMPVTSGLCTGAVVRRRRLCSTTGAENAPRCGDLILDCLGCDWRGTSITVRRSLVTPKPTPDTVRNRATPNSEPRLHLSYTTIDLIEPSDVFVSDGAKCDIMRVQQMFGPKVVSAVQDPSYPVYVDTSAMMGQTGDQDESTKQYDNIVYMPCTAENDFFPDLASLPRADIVYFCSPNNPTGAAATKAQLEELVRVCKEKGSILVFDAAYAPFIRSEGVPKTIYEIEGAKEVAIECNSFSKYAGFTGVRLGWTVVPSDLKFKDGTPVRNDFNRVMTTAFNGASNIVQSGGLACLDDEGMAEINTLIDYYLENASMLKEAMESIGYKVFGGTDAPYVFVQLPEGQSSWDAFSDILEKAQVVTIPGAGFGPGGEGYLRLSAFAPRDSVVDACKRLKEAMKQ